MDRTVRNLSLIHILALALLFFYVFDFFYSFRLELREKNCEDNREIIGRMKIN